MTSDTPDGRQTWRRPEWMALTALILGAAYERLIYGRSLGISYPLWLLLCLLSLIWLVRSERVRTAWSAWLLTVPILAVGALVALRAEPLTVFLGVVLSLWLAGMLLRALRAGGMLQWGWLDFAAAMLWVPLEAWLRPWGVLNKTQEKLTVGNRTRQRLAAVVRGLLLAFPLLVVLLVLLSSADAIFGERVEQALRWLNLERFFDMLGRITLALLMAVFFLGAVVAALRRGRDQTPLLQASGLKLPSLGLTEALVILTSVDVLFSLFVAVQFRYFFGGEAAVGAAGFTYAEYARRGFGELVAVSIITLGLVSLLAVWVRSNRDKAWSWFQLAASLLVVMTGVILVSALQRLLLYEQAFGFTRLRTYSHAAIVWMGIGFVVFLGLLLTGRLRYFAPALVAGAVGFALSLGVLNVDGFIVQQNFAHREQIGELDVDYLITLSNDAVPGLASRVDQVEGEPRQKLLADLLCRREEIEGRRQGSGWPAARWTEVAAARALQSLEPQFEPYELMQENSLTTVVRPDGEAQLCWRIQASID